MSSDQAIIERAQCDRIALSNLRGFMRQWHERAVAMGFDGVDDALAELERLRGQEPTTTARKVN